MFLECRTIRITVPKSNEVSFIFPFNQCACNFGRKGYDVSQVDPNRYTKEEIDDFLTKIEKNCGNFKKMQRYTITAGISLLAFLAMVVVGNILLNVGLAKGKGDDTGDVALAKFHKNGLVIAGSATLFIGVMQLILALILVAKKFQKAEIVL